MLKILFPFLDKNREQYSIGILDLPESSPELIGYAISPECPIVFGVEKPAAVEGFYMSTHYGGLNPYAYKIWDERVNAFRIIARVDTFSLASRHSEQIAKGDCFSVLSPSEAEVIVYAYLGMTSSQTAGMINRSKSTVHAHRESVRRKLGCRLSPVTLDRLISAHRIIEEMNWLEPKVGIGKHYTL